MNWLSHTPVLKFLSTPSARRATPGWDADLLEMLFLSTPSARRATWWTWLLPSAGNNFYPRPPRGGRPGKSGGSSSGSGISIHALREEGDAVLLGIRHLGMDISIHALREEGDACSSRPTASLSNFYPRPPRGGRRSTTSTSGAFTIFLSTPSARRATAATCTMRFYISISIHALREEGDFSGSTLSDSWANFYPRPPRGGRRKSGRTGHS